MTRTPNSLSAAKIVLALLLGLAGTTPAQGEIFRYLTSSDGDDPVLIVGDFEPPQTDKAPFLILLHGLGSTRGEWAPLVAQAAGRGWGTFAYDARGHGASRLTRRGSTVDYRDPSFGQNPLFWRKMVSDLTDAVTALNEQKKLSKKRMILVGASLGANVSLNVAALQADIPAAVLLSPGMEYAGIAAEPAVKGLSRPALLLAAKPDAYAYSSVLRLLSSTGNNPNLRKMLLEQGGPQGAHGVQLFDGKLEKRILDWIRQQTAN
ncbi:MAG TPA: alpha/beta fold hydrolase [Elusimicrobiota bacterium]|nr:alpha/beta fold hydrolase [Elusimicrobiota bacterium]